MSSALRRCVANSRAKTSGAVPDATQRVALGRTGVQVTRLGLGCAPLGNMFAALGDEQARATVEAAWELGLRWFDTAPLYGHGLSEGRLGAVLRVHPRADFAVATKVGRLLVAGSDPATIFRDTPPVRPQFDFSYDGAMRSLEASLARMGIDRVDVVHVHDPDEHELDAVDGAFRALRRLREERVIGAVGAGMNQSAMLTRFVERGLVDCVLLAGRYSILDQSGMADLLPAAQRAGVAVIAAGVFNSGLLADPQPGATFDYAPASPERIERAQRLRAVCADHGVSLRAAALQFPTRHPGVSTVLTGARSAAEIRENAHLFAEDIPGDLWARLLADGLIAE